MFRHRVNFALAAGFLAAGFICFCAVEALFLALLDWEESEGQGEGVSCQACTTHSHITLHETPHTDAVHVLVECSVDRFSVSLATCANLSLPVLRHPNVIILCDSLL